MTSISLVHNVLKQKIVRSIGSSNTNTYLGYTKIHNETFAFQIVGWMFQLIKLKGEMFGQSFAWNYGIQIQNQNDFTVITHCDVNFNGDSFLAIAAHTESDCPRLFLIRTNLVKGIDICAIIEFDVADLSKIEHICTYVDHCTTTSNKSMLIEPLRELQTILAVSGDQGKCIMIDISQAIRASATSNILQPIKAVIFNSIDSVMHDVPRRNEIAGFNLLGPLFALLVNENSRVNLFRTCTVSVSAFDHRSGIVVLGVDHGEVLCISLCDDEFQYRILSQLKMSDELALVPDKIAFMEAENDPHNPIYVWVSTKSLDLDENRVPPQIFMHSLFFERCIIENGTRRYINLVSTQQTTSLSLINQNDVLEVTQLDVIEKVSSEENQSDYNILFIAYRELIDPIDPVHGSALSSETSIVTGVSSKCLIFDLNAFYNPMQMRGLDNVNRSRPCIANIDIDYVTERPTLFALDASSLCRWENKMIPRADTAKLQLPNSLNFILDCVFCDPLNFCSVTLEKFTVDCVQKMIIKSLSSSEEIFDILQIEPERISEPIIEYGLNVKPTSLETEYLNSKELSIYLFVETMLFNRCHDAVISLFNCNENESHRKFFTIQLLPEIFKKQRGEYRLLERKQLGGQPIDDDMKMMINRHLCMMKEVWRLYQYCYKALLPPDLNEVIVANNNWIGQLLSFYTYMKYECHTAVFTQWAININMIPMENILATLPIHAANNNACRSETEPFITTLLTHLVGKLQNQDASVIKSSKEQRERWLHPRTTQNIIEIISTPLLNDCLSKHALICYLVFAHFTPDVNAAHRSCESYLNLSKSIDHDLIFEIIDNRSNKQIVGMRSFIQFVADKFRFDKTIQAEDVIRPNLKPSNEILFKVDESTTWENIHKKKINVVNCKDAPPLANFHSSILERFYCDLVLYMRGMNSFMSPDMDYLTHQSLNVRERKLAEILLHAKRLLQPTGVIGRDRNKWLGTRKEAQINHPQHQSLPISNSAKHYTFTPERASKKSLLPNSYSTLVNILPSKTQKKFFFGDSSKTSTVQSQKDNGEQEALGQKQSASYSATGTNSATSSQVTRRTSLLLGGNRQPDLTTIIEQPSTASTYIDRSRIQFSPNENKHILSDSAIFADSFKADEEAEKELLSGVQCGLNASDNKLQDKRISIVEQQEIFRRMSTHQSQNQRNQRMSNAFADVISEAIGKNDRRLTLLDENVGRPLQMIFAANVEEQPPPTSILKKKRFKKTAEKRDKCAVRHICFDDDQNDEPENEPLIHKAPNESSPVLPVRSPSPTIATLKPQIDEEASHGFIQNSDESNKDDSFEESWFESKGNTSAQIGTSAGMGGSTQHAELMSDDSVEKSWYEENGCNIRASSHIDTSSDSGGRKMGKNAELVPDDSVENSWYEENDCNIHATSHVDISADSGVPTKDAELNADDDSVEKSWYEENDENNHICAQDLRASSQPTSVLAHSNELGELKQRNSIDMDMTECRSFTRTEQPINLVNEHEKEEALSNQLRPELTSLPNLQVTVNESMPKSSLDSTYSQIIANSASERDKCHSHCFTDVADNAQNSDFSSSKPKETSTLNIETNSPKNQEIVDTTHILIKEENRSFSKENEINDKEQLSAKNVSMPEHQSDLRGVSHDEKVNSHRISLSNRKPFLKAGRKGANLYKKQDDKLGSKPVTKRLFTKSSPTANLSSTTASVKQQENKQQLKLSDRNGRSLSQISVKSTSVSPPPISIAKHTLKKRAASEQPNEFVKRSRNIRNRHELGTLSENTELKTTVDDRSVTPVPRCSTEATTGSAGSFHSMSLRSRTTPTSSQPLCPRLTRSMSRDPNTPNKHQCTTKDATPKKDSDINTKVTKRKLRASSEQPGKSASKTVKSKLSSAALPPKPTNKLTAGRRSTRSTASQQK